MSRAQAEPCRWCGGLHHELRCPKVRAVEFHPDGALKRVEFLTPGAAGPRLGHHAPPDPLVPRALVYVE